MATWNAVKPVLWSEDMGMSFADCETLWDYSTPSDILCITTKVGAYDDFSSHPPSETRKLYSNNHALALLETLIDWAECFEGEGTVAALVEKRRLP